MILLFFDALLPGLALFEAGLIRLKNSVTFITQIFMGVAILSLLWLLFGFSLSHASDNAGFIGGFENGLFANVSYTQCYSGMRVSQASYAAFMMMFAIISPLLMTGAYAERLPFPAFLCVTILWEVLVYYPVSHWVSENRMLTRSPPAPRLPPPKHNRYLISFNSVSTTSPPFRRCGAAAGLPPTAPKTSPAASSYMPPPAHPASSLAQ